MKIRYVLWAVLLQSLAAASDAQRVSSDAIPAEHLIFEEATAFAAEGAFDDSWQTLLLPDARGNTLSDPSVDIVGWRVAAVAGALRNKSKYEAADAFARFALSQSWTSERRQISRSEVAAAGYWCAWLASEILADRRSALVWAEEAAKADPESERIRVLKERLLDAERSFPSR